ncbi:hypothetical protein C8R45DRAFT_1148994 [Mycena sanguinolenta]|nr:hypothetical protein C8R45DRAFT_1148994 [Mycena sanguinolenta]
MTRRVQHKRTATVIPWEFFLIDLLLTDGSTNRRHMGKRQAEIYRAWCIKNDFESKLEEDVAAREKGAADAEEAKARLHQQTLDPHLREKPERELVPFHLVIPVTNKYYQVKLSYDALES